MSQEDLIVWPDGTDCFRHELREMSHKSDDYRVLTYGSPEWFNHQCMTAPPYEVHADEHAAKMPFSDQELRGWNMRYYRVFEDGEVWSVSPFSISNGRLFVGLNGVGYDDFYCFCDYPTALRALQEFDPKTMQEPEGWHRHYKTSRRREGGDPTKEEIWA